MRDFLWKEELLAGSREPKTGEDTYCRVCKRQIHTAAWDAHTEEHLKNWDAAKKMYPTFVRAIAYTEGRTPLKPSEMYEIVRKFQLYYAATRQKHGRAVIEVFTKRGKGYHRTIENSVRWAAHLGINEGWHYYARLAVSPTTTEIR